MPKKRADERTRTADLLITSDRSGVAGTCTGLQIPHFQRGFLSPGCPVLHRIAFSVVSKVSWITPRRFLCKADARLALRRSSPLGRSHKDGTSKPGGCRVHEATTPLYLSAAPRGTRGGLILASYAVWESAEQRFAREFDRLEAPGSTRCYRRVQAAGCLRGPKIGV